MLLTIEPRASCQDELHPCRGSHTTQYSYSHITRAQKHCSVLVQVPPDTGGGLQRIALLPAVVQPSCTFKTTHCMLMRLPAPLTKSRKWQLANEKNTRPLSGNTGRTAHLIPVCFIISSVAHK